ncbi:hypothetical protein Cgig2_013855 [Carnegiea gigantea]|uniref:Uncharacterized protein n=1 Tax=Carnegiea gigantea TaxID=171969 RepID=A0A9Q1KKP8_9CARY|nr:hypothetical protein Cgig2_013855 [Carnegiea gigantea]
MEVAGRLLLLSRRLPKGVLDWFALVPIMNVPLAHLMAYKKEYHPKAPVSLGAPWTVDQAERSGRTCKATQLTSRNKGANVVPRRGHDLRGHQLRKPKAVIEGRMIDRDILSGWLIYCRVRHRDHKSVPYGQEVLFLKGHPLQGPSWDEELVDAPSENECLDDLSEEEEDIPPKEELVLVEVPSATGFG